jgi:mannosyltransferase OCH1-like enzyme
MFTEIRYQLKRSFAYQSDLLRLLLLNKYGGVWADASLIPTTPLNTIIIKEKCRETVSWFLTTNKFTTEISKKIYNILHLTLLFYNHGLQFFFLR